MPLNEAENKPRTTLEEARSAVRLDSSCVVLGRAELSAGRAKAPKKGNPGPPRPAPQISPGLDLLHNRSGINAEIGQQFLRFAGTRQAVHGQLVDFDAVRAEFARDRVAQAAFGIMIFHRDDGVAGLLRGGLMTSLPSGLML